ncbi:MAG TPA: hypothetical protein VFE33_11525 [Thermoanaerobaculia bacterium]|nr:hypothetical protein [Thermoanaerobaculia bacterium]
MSRLAGPAFVCILALFLSLPAAALAPPVPEGPLAQVASTDGFAALPALAYRPGGDLLLITNGASWDFESCLRGFAPCAGGPLAGHVLDRFAPTPFGVPSAVGETLGRPQMARQIEIAPGPGSAFLVAWEDDLYCNIRGNSCQGGDVGSSGIAARLFADVGRPAGSTLRVNTTLPGDQTHPAVAALGSTGYVVVWQSRASAGTNWNVLGRRFDLQGEPLGGELTLPEGSAGDRQEPAVAAAADGSFLVVFRRTVDGSPAISGVSGLSGLFARRFAADGTPAAGEVQIDEGGAEGAPAAPAVVALAGGGFAVAWRGDVGSPLVANLWVRRLDALGVPQGEPLRANVQAVDAPDPSASNPNPVRPSLAADGTGGFLVAWLNHAAATGGGAVVPVYASYFGPPAETPVREIEVARAGAPFALRVAADGDHAYTVLWGRFAPGLPGSSIDLYEARRFTLPGGACTPGPGTLCLAGGRFRVEARWHDQHNEKLGDGSALPFSDATGLF